MSQSASQTKQHLRDPWFDNARWLAGTLVVLVHVFGRYRDDVFAVEWLWFGTWSYRIPLFAILVGIFSTATPVSRDFRQLITRILIPLVVLSAFHAGISYFEGDGVPYPWEPQYTLWFLYAIIVWRLLLPVIASFRWPILVAILISITVGLGAFEGDPFGLTRMAANLPFVVIGWWLKSNSGWLRQRNWLKTLAALTVVTITAVASWILVSQEQLVAADFAGLTQLTTIDLVIQRLVILLAGLLGALAVLYLLPRGKVAVLTGIGRNGYQIYLLHGILLTVIGLFVTWPSAKELGATGLSALLVGGILFAALLGSKPIKIGVERFFTFADWLISPKPRS